MTPSVIPFLNHLTKCNNILKEKVEKIVIGKIFRSARTSSSSSVCKSVTLLNCNTVTLHIYSTAASQHCSTVALQDCSTFQADLADFRSCLCSFFFDLLVHQYQYPKIKTGAGQCPIIYLEPCAFFLALTGSFGLFQSLYVRQTERTKERRLAFLEFLSEPKMYGQRQKTDYSEREI